MVAFVDPRTKQIIECNEVLAEAIGYKKASLIGRSIFDIHDESCRHSVKTVYAAFMKTKSVPDAELTLSQKRGGNIPVSLRISGSEDERGQVRCTRFSWHNITKQKRVQNSLLQEQRRLKQHLGSRLVDLRQTKKKARHELQRRKTAEAQVSKAVRLLRQQRNQLQQLAGRLISIQEDERRRLARDLHDDTCQKLGMLAFQVESLEQNPPKSSKAIQKELQGLHHKISTLTDDIRSISHQLHPAILDYVGVVKALEEFIGDFVQRENLQTEFTFKQVPKHLPPSIANCVYRVAQECLGNSAKHSQATKVVVSLRGFTKSLRLSIRDNGTGVSKKQKVSVEQGLGLISIRERLRLVKGRLRITTKRQYGTDVSITIPYSFDQS